MHALYSNDPDEQYANAFAMALLMPEPQVRACATLKMSTEEMAERFGVTVEVMALRRRDIAEQDANPGGDGK